MAPETRKALDNQDIVQQLLNDVRGGCYEGCAVRITACKKNGTSYEVLGPVNAIDLSHQRIKIDEAQAIEGVSLEEITDYELLG